jgi:hypothetical protein
MSSVGSGLSAKDESYSIAWASHAVFTWLNDCKLDMYAEMEFVGSCKIDTSQDLVTESLLVWEFPLA